MNIIVPEGFEIEGNALKTNMKKDVELISHTDQKLNNVNKNKAKNRKGKTSNAET